MTSFSDFDLITPREVSRHGSAEAVVSHLRSAFQKAKATADGLLTVEPLGHSLVQNRLHQIPACLWSDYSKASDNLGLDLPSGRRIFMQAARHRGQHSRYKFADSDLVIVDRDILIRSALFLYFSLRSKSDINFLMAKSFAFVYSATRPNQPLPLQYHIVWCLMANVPEQKLFLECLNCLLDFVALHEIGHVCAESCFPKSSFFHVELHPADTQSDGEQLYDLLFRRPTEDQDTIKIPNPMSKGQVEELFCDAFALTARVIMDASGTFTPMVFQALSHRMFLLGQFFSLEDMCTTHGEGPSGQINIGRLKVANREVPPGQPLLNDLKTNVSHPSGVRRWDSLILHAEWITRKFHLDTHPLALDGDVTLQQDLSAIWNNGIRIEQDMIIDSLRAPGLEGAEYHVGKWDALTEALRVDDKTPNNLKSFAYSAFAPYLLPFVQILGDKADEIFPASIVEKLTVPMERLPSNTLFAGIVNRLCLTLSDPHRYLNYLRHRDSNNLNR